MLLRWGCCFLSKLSTQTKFWLAPCAKDTLFIPNWFDWVETFPPHFNASQPQILLWLNFLHKNELAKSIASFYHQNPKTMYTNINATFATTCLIATLPVMILPLGLTWFVVLMEKCNNFYCDFLLCGGSSWWDAVNIYISAMATQILWQIIPDSCMYILTLLRCHCFTLLGSPRLADYQAWMVNGDCNFLMSKLDHRSYRLMFFFLHFLHVFLRKIQCLCNMNWKKQQSFNQ